jgi:hypothetical protein
MTIEISRVGDRYRAAVTRPHGERQWTSPQPMSRAELVAALLGLGCHQTDIGDAFYVADPDWLDPDR